LVNSYGRIRHLPDDASNSMLRSAVNFMIQGLGAQIMKEVVVEIEEKYEKDPNPPVVATVIHDEIVIETTLDRGEEVSRVLKTSMEKVITGKVNMQLKTDPEYGLYSLSKNEKGIPLVI